MLTAQQKEVEALAERLTRLARELEDAPKGDTTLDLKVLEALLPRSYRESHVGVPPRASALLRPTTLVDDATFYLSILFPKTLITCRILPGQAKVMLVDDGLTGSATAKTEPLARCAALLRLTVTRLRVGAGLQVDTRLATTAGVMSRLAEGEPR